MPSNDVYFAKTRERNVSRHYETGTHDCERKFSLNTNRVASSFT